MCAFQKSESIWKTDGTFCHCNQCFSTPVGLLVVYLRRAYTIQPRSMWNSFAQKHELKWEHSSWSFTSAFPFQNHFHNTWQSAECLKTKYTMCW